MQMLFRKVPSFIAATSLLLLTTCCGGQDAGRPDTARQDNAGQKAGQKWLAGLSKVDVTPTEPVRMAGYGNRDHASEGIDTPLYVRCLALSPAGGDQPASLLLSVDTIGLPGSLTRELAISITKKHGTPREKIIFCSTHTHCGPDLVSELSNIFSVPLTDEEAAAGKRYKSQLRKGILEAVELALSDLAPATLHYAVGETGFAANRRVLTNGRWSGFGVQADGPVDHTVPVLRINGDDGATRGVVFNYACHCTTLGGRHYKINAEWAGYACASLESTYPDAVALCTIGCGADANPDPRESLDATKLHGRTLAAEVKRVIATGMAVVDAPLETRFDYAGLSFDLPTAEELEQRASSTNPQAKRHAQQLLEIYRRERRLPATYPVPIQAWRFGDQLTMIFLGGEVVVDYALRLKETFDDPNLWVTAYANDVLGYIASERMRTEGGYEFDRSGVYYALPGPWAAGTEDFLIRRIQDLLESRGRSKPLSPDQALQSFRLSDGLKIELVAAEPLVQDPINIAFGEDGRLWVVEMGDYPSGENGGRVKVLSDTDGDGVFDSASLFLSGLPYPTGVQPWRDGALIVSAPDILMARDSDGDGQADQVEKLYTGFRLANPQHRINGFTYGLDHSLHCASGDNLGKITASRSGAIVNASGHDVKIWPDEGRLAATSGRTQYIRSRDDWGQWFGSDNSRPMFHFPIDSAYLKRNEAVTYPGNIQQLFDPPVAPPVFPLTSSSERFNDLFAANRFTSACSSIVFRDSTFHEPGQQIAFVCEPVHNLVHRAILEPMGASYRASRTAQKKASEFLASTDPWFRPARAITGPDGALWIVDMYRETIEHPQWIPQAWQQQLDLRAGEDRGRIYRISTTDAKPKWNAIDHHSTAQLINLLRSSNGTLRDMAQRLIIQRDEQAAIPLLRQLASDDSPQARVHALSILAVVGQLSPDDVLSGLADNHPGVLLVAIRLCEPLLQQHPELLVPLKKLAEHGDQPVVLRTALALGETDNAAAGEILSTIAIRSDLDRWIARAIISSCSPHVNTIATRLVKHIQSGKRSMSDVQQDLLSKLLLTAQAAKINVWTSFGDILSANQGNLRSQLQLAAIFVRTIKAGESHRKEVAQQLGPLYQQAVQLIQDPQQTAQQRCQAMSLLGIGIATAESERELLISLLSVNTPPQVQMQAIDCLTASGDSTASNDLLDRWPSMSKSVRDHYVNRMLTRRAWIEHLLDALESKHIRVNDLTAAARQQLVKAGGQSTRVRAVRILGDSGSVEKKALVRSYLSQFNASRNAVNGETLFKKHCAVCHVPDSQGRATGASLANLSDRSDRVLVEAILDPNRAVDPKYQNYIVETEDGRILSGAIEEEAGTSITLAHADGKRTTIRRSEIASMKNSGLSLMPEGFEDIFPPEALQDVVQYLGSFQRP